MPVMSFPAIVILSVALAVDAFSVAAAAAPRSCRRWGPLRLSAAFGIFQALMPLLGALASDYLLAHVREYDHWVAFGLLEVIGLKMLVESLWPRGSKEADEETSRGDPSVGWSLLGLSVATSIDAFGAGVGMRLAGANLLIACPTIGLVAAALTYLGARTGRVAERRFGRKAEVLGGLVLVALGIRMLWI